ncbi:MAG: S-methyl-5-thioribose-1-phosphate isomerase [Halanaerobium sp. MSAO_Bac5]|nr:MAG: S-methyl-5-thioribose-1-phosphate isomerase [Halanaerobium sp. MSAO_Bac5]
MKNETMYFENNKLKLIDQRKLPLQIEYFSCKNYHDAEFAISEMVVRGAPAIGAAAAYGFYLAALEFAGLPEEELEKELKKAADKLIAARPTAVNLSWAVEQLLDLALANLNKSEEEFLAILKDKADQIADSDRKINKKMAENGNKLIKENAVILTHCNAGSLATVDYGTALGVIREAHYTKKNIKVFADETRPRLQGARLTAFELMEEGIDVTLIADSTAATLIRDGKIDYIITGADRIAANGDTANKIGTFMLSELAKNFAVPFYVAAPLSTIDRKLASGSLIEIEERDSEEITQIEGVQIAPENVKVYNPAFDITPAENIDAIITEKGIVKNPDKKSIAELFQV